MLGLYKAVLKTTYYRHIKALALQLFAVIAASEFVKLRDQTWLTDYVFIF